MGPSLRLTWARTFWSDSLALILICFSTRKATSTSVRTSTFTFRAPSGNPQNTYQTVHLAPSYLEQAAQTQIHHGAQCRLTQPKYMIADPRVLFPANVTSAGTPTGSPSGPPPPVSNETSSALKEASEEDPIGQSAPGKDAHDNDQGQVIMGEAGKPKTAKESMDDPAGPHGSVS